MLLKPLASDIRYTEGNKLLPRRKAELSNDKDKRYYQLKQK